MKFISRFLQENRGIISQKNLLPPSCSHPKTKKKCLSQKKRDETDLMYPMRLLRQERQLSQYRAGKKLGLSRSQVQQLERKTSEQLTMGEYTCLSQGFGIDFESLLQRFWPKSQTLHDRSDREHPFFSIDFEKGVSLNSYLKDPRTHFIGALHLDPQKSLESSQAPGGPAVFCFVLEGEIMLQANGRNHHLKPGDFFSLLHADGYEIRNEHPFKSAEVLFFVIPSFIGKCGLKPGPLF